MLKYKHFFLFFFITIFFERIYGKTELLNTVVFKIHDKIVMKSFIKKQSIKYRNTSYLKCKKDILEKIKTDMFSVNKIKELNIFLKKKDFLRIINAHLLKKKGNQKIYRNVSLKYQIKKNLLFNEIHKMQFEKSIMVKRKCMILHLRDMISKNVINLKYQFGKIFIPIKKHGFFLEKRIIKEIITSKIKRYNLSQPLILYSSDTNLFGNSLEKRKIPAIFLNNMHILRLDNIIEIIYTNKGIYFYKLFYRTIENKLDDIELYMKLHKQLHILT